MRMTREHQVALALADALLSGTASLEDFAARLAQALGRNSRWIPGLSRRVFQRFGSQLRHPQRAVLIEFIRADKGYHDAWRATRKPRIVHYFLDPPPMEPRPGALAACALPALPTPGDLAAWLGITVSELDWYADTRGMNDRSTGPLGHYRYRWIPKRHGAWRIVEAPKPKLRAIQRRILREILDPVPAHRAAHGFRPGHSCLTHARPHVAQRVVLKMDLRNFFVSIPARRINALFKTLGYPEATARVLTGLCTSRVPSSVLRALPQGNRIEWLEGKQLREPHLPQGAPTSPALSNLCALHLDLRVDALAQSLGAVYTRYADDLAMSGGEPLRRQVSKVSALVAAIAKEEGFRANHHKTRVMHHSARQMLTGIVVNEHPNVRRHDYDRIKAVLHNCARGGPASQNRDGRGDFREHLLGRIGYVKQLNPARGAKLEALFARIEWQETGDRPQFSA
jgi:retron-type reverse transcriptase